MARGNDAKTRGWLTQEHCKCFGCRKHDKLLCSIPGTGNQTQDLVPLI